VGAVLPSRRTERPSSPGAAFETLRDASGERSNNCMVVSPHPAPLRRSEEKQPQIYTETLRERFHRRANALSLSALNLRDAGSLRGLGSSRFRVWVRHG
jgi:hypothetical protein